WCMVVFFIFQTRSNPLLEFKPKRDDIFNSVLLFDADYPCEQSKRLQEYILWSNYNNMSSNKCVFNLKDVTNGQAFIPPHPQRGSGVHRIILVVVEHPQEIPNTDTRLFNFKNFFNAIPNARITGFTFF